MKVLRGVSLSGTAAPELLAEKAAGEFPLVEFEGELLENNEFCRMARKIAARRNAPGFTVRNLISESLAQLAPGESSVVRQEFARAFRERCRRAAELHAVEVGLAFDLDRSFSDPGYREKMFLLLRGFFGVLEEFALTLRFTVRIPAAAPLERYAAFRRELSYPRLGMEIEPAASGAGLPALPELAGFLAPLRFHSDCWHFRRDAVSGALPGRELTERIAEAAGELCAAPRRFLFPVASPAELAETAELAAGNPIGMVEELPGFR